MAVSTPTAMAPTQSKAKAPTARVWGDKGVSEKFIVQDQQMIETPTFNQLTLADAGLLSELMHHHYGAYTIATATRDVFGPYTYLNLYQFFAGSNTPLISLGGEMLGILQIIEYPFTSNEVPSDTLSVENPLTNSSDYFNYPSATGPMRVWTRVPVALRLAGVRGGYVGYITLQNKRIANTIKPSFNLFGASSPFSATAASGFGQAAYVGGTVTAAPIFETWKVLNTVPRLRSQMPLFGFTRYIQQVQQPYSGTSFTYDFEPGGELMRAVFQFVDATAAGGMATANLASIVFQYGTNKQMDVYTPYRNIQEQIHTYGRALPQGCMIFDYYTRHRTLVDTKSTENTANVQVVAQFSPGYSVPANSVVNVMLDKVFVVQNYLGK